MLRRLSTAIATLMLIAPVAWAQPPTSPAQEGFVPASQLPPGQEMPAAPLVVASYAFFLALMMFYLWTIWRRIGKVEKEMHDLERRHGTAR